MALNYIYSTIEDVFQQKVYVLVDDMFISLLGNLCVQVIMLLHGVMTIC